MKHIKREYIFILNQGKMNSHQYLWTGDFKSSYRCRVRYQKLFILLYN